MNGRRSVCNITPDTGAYHNPPPKALKFQLTPGNTDMTAPKDLPTITPFDPSHGTKLHSYETQILIFHENFND